MCAKTIFTFSFPVTLTYDLKTRVQVTSTPNLKFLRLSDSE